MSNLQIAKQHVNNHVFEVLKIFGVVFGLGIITGILSSIPILGLLLLIIVELFTMIFTIYSINELVIEEKTTPVTDLLRNTVDLIKFKGLPIIKNYLFMWLCLIPIVLILVLIISASFIGMFMNLNASLSLLFMTMVGVLLVCIAMFYIEYRFLYIFSGIVFDKDGKQAFKSNKLEVLRMGLVILLLAMIPIIGWILSIVWSIYYQTRIVLDVRNA